MAKTNIRTPFFVFNPKSFLFGEKLLELVREADALAEEFPISIFVTAPFADIAAVSSENIADAITCLRQGKVRWNPGFDGQFGTMELVHPFR